MHLIHTAPKSALISEALEPAPFGPGFSMDDLLHIQVDRMEVWGTSFTDDEEYCEFRLLNEAGEVLKTKRVEGY